MVAQKGIRSKSREALRVVGADGTSESFAAFKERTSESAVMNYIPPGGVDIAHRIPSRTKTEKVYSRDPKQIESPESPGWLPEASGTRRFSTLGVDGREQRPRRVSSEGSQSPQDLLRTLGYPDTCSRRHGFGIIHSQVVKASCKHPLCGFV